jgi:chromate transporter
VAAAVFCALWALPFALLAITGSGTGAFLDIAIFFSQMAVVTFGGAYAVLAFVAQQAVETYGWLQPAEMIDGLALAETTPGPLVLVLGFVGFLAGFRDPGALPPLVGGFAGLTLATWVTFVPCFLWIFVFAPHMERLRNSAALAGALSAILAAIVGVIANLALWFALHVLFADVGRLTAGPVSMPWPGWSGIDPAATLLAGAAAVALLRYRLPMLAVLASAAAAGPAMLLFGNILHLG